MKQILFYLLLPVLLGTACTSFETEVPGGEGEAPGGVALTIRSLNLSVDTRAICDSLGSAANELDTIGLLVTKNTPAEYYSAEKPTQTFVYADTKWNATDTLTLENAIGTVYAWAPVLSDQPGGLNDTKVPVMQLPLVRANQTFAYGNEWETDQTDYLYGSAGPSVGDATHPTVNRDTSEVKTLYMQHALAKISFRILKTKGQTVGTDDYVKRIRLGNTAEAFVVSPSPATGSAMSLADGAFSGMKASDSLTFTATTRGAIGEWAEKGQEEAKVPDYSSLPFAQIYGLVAPATVGQLVIALTLGPNDDLNATTDRVYSTKADEAALKNVVWTKGRHYLYTMTVSDRGITLAKVEVVGWDTALETEVPVEPEVPETPVEPELEPEL